MSSLISAHLLMRIKTLFVRKLSKCGWTHKQGIDFLELLPEPNKSHYYLFLNFEISYDVLSDPQKSPAVAGSDICGDG